MKSFRSFYLWILPGTLLALLYVHQEILQVETSYCIRRLSQTLREQSIRYEQLTLDLKRQTRPDKLEEQAKALDLGLAVPARVYRLARPAEPAAPRAVEPPAGPMQRLMRLFSFAGEVYAKDRSNTQAVPKDRYPML